MFAFPSLQNYTRMKKISYYLPFLLLFTTLVFISCDDEQLEGEFFSTPDGSDPEVFCQETGPLAIAEAQLALLGLDPSEAQAGCDAFIATINSFINTCGDEGGALQLLLDELGTDCNLTTDGGDGDDGSFTAIIDGNMFTAQEASAGFIAGVFNITGTRSNGETIIITLSDFDGEGTYDIGANNTSSSGGAYLSMTGANAFLSAFEDGTGSITVTEFDIANSTTSGTFEFVANDSLSEDSVTITSGVFTNLPIQTDVPPGDPDNSLNVLIDGISLNPDSVVGVIVDLAGDLIINIVANNNTTGQNLGITIPANITPGTYEFDFIPTSSDDVIGLYNPDLNAMMLPFSANMGSLTIINNDALDGGLLQGTFEFLAEPAPASGQEGMFELTEGEFSINF